jgi:hypothetical protein
LSINALILTALFMALVLAASMQGLAASGHFPRRRKAPAAAAGVGAAVLLGSMALVTASLVGGTVAAPNFIPWYAAVIGGGLSVLATPLVLQWFPDRFVDGRNALLAFAALSVAPAVLLLWVWVWVWCHL